VEPVYWAGPYNRSERSGGDTPARSVNSVFVSVLVSRSQRATTQCLVYSVQLVTSFLVQCGLLF
jgi:hypothetical protein